jgi:predicted esterase
VSEAFLGSALDRVTATLDVARDVGVTAERVVLVGFSQGAAVALEYATRHPRRYGGVAALAGGLLGPTGDLTPPAGSLAGTQAFCGVGVDDPHVPVAHVEASGRVLDGMGATTTVETYPGLGHAINDDEFAAVNRLIAAVAPE